MAKNRNGSKQVTMKPIAGRPGLFTVIGMTKSEKTDRQFVAKVLRDAKALKARILANG